MTDYIALALEDQEERENNETAELLLEQHSAAGVRREKTRRQGLEEPVAEGGGAVWSGNISGTGGQTGKVPGAGQTELISGQTQAWLETAESVGAGNWLEETAAVFRRRLSVGGGLYQRLRQAQTAAEYRPNRTNVALLTAEEGNGSVQGLAELDRAFQRDARRYDGGFELY